jgi:hypothetical protein
VITTVADTASERLLAPTEIARQLQVSPSAILRWLTRGVQMADGSRLRLRSIRLPGSYRVRPEWLDEFLERVGSDRAGKPDDSPKSTPARSGRIDEMNRRLTDAGFLPSQKGRQA